jgi:fumarate reductase flavoprotein subunit
VSIPFPGHPGSTGDGIVLGLSVGGVVENMSSFQPYPAHIGPGKRGLPPGVIMSGGIMVDAFGRRFVDESTYPGGVAAAILDLPGCRAFEVFDEAVFQEHRDGAADRALGAMLEVGDLHRADSTSDLAQALGVDPGGLASAIDAYNRRAGGDSDEFGRQVERALVPPFYGAEVTVALYHTQGGLRINDSAQVLRADGSVIENLYAGGGVAAGISGGGVDGYLPGNGLLASLGLGLIAAEHAVASSNRAAGAGGQQ